MKRKRFKPISRYVNREVPQIVLLVLLENKEELFVSEIKREASMRLKNPTSFIQTVDLLDKFLKVGLIKKRFTKRKIFIKLTPKGEKIAKKIKKIRKLSEGV